MRALDRLAEAKIQEAIEAGEFDDLPGKGRPLPPENMGRVPPELRAGFKLLRNGGFLPPELEARREAVRLGNLIGTTGDPSERERLTRLRAEAEIRYRLLAERRLR